MAGVREDRHGKEKGSQKQLLEKLSGGAAAHVSRGSAGYWALLHRTRA